jgi:hypothetical protein
MKRKKKSFLFICFRRPSETLSTEVNETENDVPTPIQTSESTISETADDMETKAVPSVSSTIPKTSGKFPLVVHLKQEEIHN